MDTDANLREQMTPEDCPLQVIVDDQETRAYCPTPESAILAARTLLREAWEARPVQGYDPSADFYVNGEFARRMTLRALNR